MAFEFDIKGTDSIEKILQGLPQKYAKRPMVATFRKGARIFTKELRQNTPKATGETRKAIKVKAQRGIGITAGFSGQSSYLPGYFKALWANYGTLENRDSSHTFSRARKAKTSSWSGGIKAQKFVERSWDNTKKQVQDTINKELKTETLKFLNKYKVN